MKTVNNGGDVLARGGVRANFGGPKVSQEKWDAIFGEDSGPTKRGSSSSSDQAGDVSTDSGKPRRRSKKSSV